MSPKPQKGNRTMIQIKRWDNNETIHEGDFLAFKECFRDGKYKGVSFYRADMSGADMRGADMSGADMSGANMRRADMRRADMSGANMRGANMRGADMSGADMSGADMRRADMSGANMSGADMSGANMSGANMRGADMSGAAMSGADMSGAAMSGASLSEAKGVTYAQCAFSGFGECGRMLTGILVNEEPRFWSGCLLDQNEEEIREYIDRKNQSHYKKSHLLGLEFILKVLST